MNHVLQQASYFSQPAAETVVWKNLLNGDKKALGHIYTKYFDKLYNYGSRISKESIVVEDAIQDLFIEIWNRRAGLNQDVQNIRQYLYICLRRNIVQKLAKRNASVDIHELSGFDLELSDKSHYLNNRINSELSEKLVEMIGMLTPKQKEAIFLIYFDELSYPEVASIMSLKIKTVYNLVHQAIAKLKGRKHVFWQMISFTF